MRYAQFSQEGFPNAFYSEDVHGDEIPSDAVQITDEQWIEFLTNQGMRRWDGVGVVPYDPPPMSPVIPSSVSDRQFFQALAMRGEISEPEALEAVGPGIIPARMLALIEQLPAGSQFGAKMLIRGATTFERDNPLAGLIGTLFGWDAEALDEFWTFAATL